MGLFIGVHFQSTRNRLYGVEDGYRAPLKSPRPQKEK